MSEIESWKLIGRIEANEFQNMASLKSLIENIDSILEYKEGFDNIDEKTKNFLNKIKIICNNSIKFILCKKIDLRTQDFLISKLIFLFQSLMKYFKV